MIDHTKYYKVAGITIQINSDFPITDNTFHPKFKLFETDSPGNDNVVINHHFSIPDKIISYLSSDKSKKLFSNEFLSVYKTKTKWIYKHKFSTAFNIKYNAIVVFNDDHTLGDVYTNDLNKSSYSNAELSSVVLFGGDHYLMSNILSSRNGLLLHANGLIYQGKGIILVGQSGAGKSTLSNMLQDSGLDIVADDRIILQKEDSKIYLIGSWCHGSVINVTNQKVLIEKIFFLEKSTENKIIFQTSNHEKLKQFARSIVRPFGDQKKWGDILNNMDDIMKKQLFYSIYFDLSKDICNILKGEL